MTTITAPTVTPTLRRRMLGALLIAAAGLALIAGVWGASAARQLHARENPAGIGQLVEVPGGSVRVDQAESVSLAHNPGMPEEMMVDPVSEGFRRVSVHLTLFAEHDGGLAYRREMFRLTGSGMGSVVPRAGQLDDGHLPPGRALTTSLEFEIPEDATAVALSVDGAARLVAIDPGPVTDHDHP